MWSDRHASLLPSDLVNSGYNAANVAIGVVSCQTQGAMPSMSAWQAEFTTRSGLPEAKGIQ